jgi:hypothetical protein
MEQKRIYSLRPATFEGIASLGIGANPLPPEGTDDEMGASEGAGSISGRDGEACLVEEKAPVVDAGRTGVAAERRGIAAAGWA